MSLGNVNFGASGTLGGEWQPVSEEGNDYWLSRCWILPAQAPAEGFASAAPSHLHRASERTRAQELEIPITPN